MSARANAYQRIPASVTWRQAAAARLPRRQSLHDGGNMVQPNNGLKAGRYRHLRARRARRRLLSIGEDRAPAAAAGYSAKRRHVHAGCALPSSAASAAPAGHGPSISIVGELAQRQHASTSQPALQGLDHWLDMPSRFRHRTCTDDRAGTPESRGSAARPGNRVDRRYGLFRQLAISMFRRRVLNRRHRQ